MHPTCKAQVEHACVQGVLSANLAGGCSPNLTELRLRVLGPVQVPDCLIYIFIYIFSEANLANERTLFLLQGTSDRAPKHAQGPVPGEPSTALSSRCHDDLPAAASHPCPSYRHEALPAAMSHPVPRFRSETSREEGPATMAQPRSSYWQSVPRQELPAAMTHPCPSYRQTSIRPMAAQSNTTDQDAMGQVPDELMSVVSAPPRLHSGQKRSKTYLEEVHAATSRDLSAVTNPFGGGAPPLAYQTSPRVQSPS